MSQLIELFLEALFKIVGVFVRTWFALPSARFKTKLELTPEELSDDKKSPKQTVEKGTVPPKTIIRRGEN